MKEYLITGGCGFIGSNFIRHLLKVFKNINIVNLDSLTYAGNPENLLDIKKDKRYTFIEGDITDSSMVSNIVNYHDFDVAVHFAAESHVDRSIKDPGIFTTVNVLGTQNLLISLADFWEGDFKSKRFIYISTDEVYGELGEDGFFTEETKLAPNSPYSASKTGADLLVRAYNRTFGFPGIITRCSNNYGPYQYPEKLIPLMIANAVDDKPLPVYGKGVNIRDWIHVTDHCKAISKIIKSGRIGEVYNIGGGNEWKNIDIVKKILLILGKPESLIKFVQDRLGHDLRYAIDASKIKSELDWKPTVDFGKGLEKTVKWYIENEKWWRKLQKKK